MPETSLSSSLDDRSSFVIFAGQTPLTRLMHPMRPMRPARRCGDGGVSRTVLFALAGLILLALTGCDRNIEPFQPGETPSPPDLARIFPDAPSGPGSAAPPAGGAGMRGNTGGTPTRTALPPSRAEGSATAAAASGAAPISGQILLADGLAGARPDGGVLFVIARPQGARGGPPLAVLRIPDPSFPLDFTIGPENVMIPSMRFEGAISLSARLDADGNAMTRGAGDISSDTKEPLSPGTNGVELLLSERG